MELDLPWALAILSLLFLILMHFQWERHPPILAYCLLAHLWRTQIATQVVP
jgi:hypothetical protein